ncbi:MAG: AAA domain-containing protein [Chloroflexi bacterium]|nr:AAA domain-containing protein [Chloroflexota bacterium]
MKRSPNMTDLAPSQFRETAQRIEDEVRRVIVGQHNVVRHTLIALLADGHLLLEGLPGLGKTMLVRTLAAVLQLEFTRVQFTPDLMPADIIGTDVLEVAEASERRFRFHRGPVFTNLLLADEINRATPKTQSALLEAMQERQVSAGGTTHALPRPFLVLATQNPIELEGTYPLPEAQLDRFLFKVNVGYPTAEELTDIVGRTTGAELPTVSPVADGDTVRAMQALARGVPIATPVRAYAARLTLATHPDDATAPERVQRFVRYGASPRGAQALIWGGKVHALLDGRYNVALSDLHAMAPAALRHRLILTYEAEAEGVTPDDILAALLEATSEP